MKKGPALSGVIVSAFGFRAMLFVVAIIGIAYAPLMLLLKNPPAKEENMVFFRILFNLICFNILTCYYKSLIMNERSQSIKYVSYNNQNRSSETLSDPGDY